MARFTLRSKKQKKPSPLWKRGLVMKKCIICSQRVICKVEDDSLPRCAKHVNEMVADISVGKVAERLKNGMIHLQWRGHTLGYFKTAEILIMVRSMLGAVEQGADSNDRGTAATADDDGDG